MTMKSPLPEELQKPACKNCSRLIKKGDEFCSNSCKGLYSKRTGEEFIARVSKRILLNRNILKELCKNKTITKQILSDAGFDFNYHTQYFRSLIFTDKMYCFDYGIEFMQPGIRLFRVDINKV